MSDSKVHNTSRRLSRREFALAGAAVLASQTGGPVPAETEPARSTAGTTGTRLAMVIDLDRCIGCQACAVACKSENGVRLGGFRSWVSEKEVGGYPNVTRYFLPRSCNHCQEPACLKVCPVGATFKRPDGLVDVDKRKCIGCRYCMVACPYGARYFNPRRDPEGAKLFPARTRGTVDKCNFCAHRVDNDVVPACVNTCPAGARVFGDLNDPESEVFRVYSSEHTVALLPDFGTGPSVWYKGGNPQLFEKEPRQGDSRNLDSGRRSA
jgi:tetrathionate reductase subunit B